MTESHLSLTLITECKQKLLRSKAEILNRLKITRNEYSSRDRGGDEVDCSADILAENQFMVLQDRLRKQILEIECALHRIQQGTFGICEETEEPIEVQRLLTMPWTRLSLEGAEIKESLTKRYAKA